MAYLRRHPRSPFWFAVFYGPDRRNTSRMRRFDRSTGTSNRSVAQRLAVEFETAARKAGEGILTVDHCRKVLDELLALTDQGLDKRSTREFVGDWLGAKRKTRAASTAVRYQSILDEFLEHLGKKADMRPEALLPQDVIAYRDGILEAGKSAGSVRLEIKIVRSLLRAAQNQGLVHRNVAEACEVDESAATSKEHFSTDELRSLLKTAGDTDWRTAILLGALAGLRLGDAANLTWAAVDLVNRELVVKPQKTSRKGRVLRIPIHPSLAEHLLSKADSDDPAGALCPVLAGHPVGGKTGLSSRFLDLMARAGVGLERSVARGRGRTVASRSFHSLRHSFNTALLRAGVDEAIRMKLSGHTSTGVNRIYSKAESDSLRGAIETLPKL
ncbi:MAG: tyrosine-type recombinase/integrase [Verrucomicrobiales bacterium]